MKTPRAIGLATKASALFTALAIASLLIAAPRPAIAAGPQATAVTVERLSAPDQTIVRINGPACPKGSAYVDYSLSPGPANYGGGANGLQAGKRWYGFAMIEGRLGTQTMTFRCKSAAAKVLKKYPPVTVHVTRKAMRLVVKPATVRRGQQITLSSPNGCGKSAKPTELSYNVYSPSVSKEVLGAAAKAPTSGLWSPFKVTIPKKWTTGKGSATVNCYDGASFVYSRYQTFTIVK